MTSEGGGLAGNTLHQATITKEGIGVVVGEGEVGLVEGSGSLGLGNGKTDGVGDTLAEGASGDLNTGGVMGLRVARGPAVDGLYVA